MSLDIFRTFVVYSELLSAIVGTIYFYKYKHTPLKYFLFLLWYITLTEFTGWYASENKIFGFFDNQGRHYNLWLYNLMYSIFFPVTLTIYFKSIKRTHFKRWIKAFIILYVIIYIINWVFIQNFKYEWMELPKVVGCLFLITVIIFYFIELLKSNHPFIFHKKLLFWISTGLLIFYTGIIPFTVKVTKYALMKGIHNLFLIIWVLAILMYLIFTFGFIWSDSEEKIN